MKKLSILLIIFAAFLTLSLSTGDTAAAESGVTKGDRLSLSDSNGPKKYTVKEGDTLWDISVDKLNDNFFWPKLWKVNPQVKNPDLIYPGDLIWIPTKEELMRMSFPAEKKARIAEPVTTTEEPVKPVMDIPEEKPIEYLIDKNRYIAIGWIFTEHPGIGKIMMGPSGRTIFGNHDTAYVKTDKDLTEGDRLLTVRKVKTVYHPKTGKKLGVQIKVTGILEVTGKVDDYIKTNITKVFFEEIFAGDDVTLFMETDPPVVPEVIRKPDIDGYIVESYLNSIMSNKDDIVYLDKGTENGLIPGDTFTIFSDEHIKRPIGTLQVVSLTPETSAAVILDNKIEISKGNSWGRNR